MRTTTEIERDARRRLTLDEGCNETSPITVRIAVHANAAIGSLTFDRAWSTTSHAMTRADLERVFMAIGECLEDTEQHS